MTEKIWNGKDEVFDGELNRAGKSMWNEHQEWFMPKNAGVSLQEMNDTCIKYNKLMKKIEQIDFDQIRNLESFIDENSRDAAPSRLAKLRGTVRIIEGLI